MAPPPPAREPDVEAGGVFDRDSDGDEAPHPDLFHQRSSASATSDTRSMASIESVYMPWWSWRRVVPYIWVAVVICTVFGVVPWLIIELHHHRTEKHVIAWFVAGICTALTVPITVWDVAQHLTHWRNGSLQGKEIRIVWMAAIYSGASFLSLRFMHAAEYLDSVRSLYEAYCIFNLFGYFLQYARQLGVEDDFRNRPDAHHMFPFCKLKPWPMTEFFFKTSQGIVAYIIFQVVATPIALFSQFGGVYREGEVSGRSVWFYLAIVQTLVQSWAIYDLILLVHTLADDLKPTKPIHKVAIVKAVVFVSFWQGLLISILQTAGVIKTDPTWTTYNKQSVSAGLQDFLICVEMLIASFFHHYYFSYKEFEGRRERLTVVQSLRNLFTVEDVVSDVHGHLAEATTKLPPVLSQSRLARRISGGRLESENSDHASINDPDAADMGSAAEPLDSPTVRTPLLANSQSTYGARE